MFDPSKAIKKMLGPGIKIPKFGKPNSADLDGDGIPNLRDCQPKNMFRQDKFRSGNTSEAKNFVRNSYTKITYYHSTSPSNVNKIKNIGFTPNQDGVIYFSTSPNYFGNKNIKVKLNPKRPYDVDKYRNKWYDWLRSKNIKEEDTDIEEIIQFLNENNYDSVISESGDWHTMIKNPNDIFIIK